MPKTKLRSVKKTDGKTVRKSNHSMERRATRVVITNTRGMYMVWATPLKQPLFYSMGRATKAIKQIYPSAVLREGLLSCPIKWRVKCLVLCRDQSGDQYICGKGVTLNSPYYYPTLIKMLDDEHMELLQSCNPNHVLNVGWINSTSGAVISNDDADLLMQEVGAWDYLAKWEQPTEEEISKNKEELAKQIAALSEITLN